MGNCGDTSETAKPNVQAAQQKSNIKQCQHNRPAQPAASDPKPGPQQPTNTTPDLTKNPQVINPNTNSNSNPTKQQEASNMVIHPFAKQQLRRHNEYRALHHAQPLVISEWLTKRAQEWAEHLVKIDELQHSNCKINGKTVGQNIYWGTREPMGGPASTAWYDQVQDYQYGKGQSTFSKTGHFSQVVWKASRQVGFGYAGQYVVANYYPAGNFKGSWQKNVMKP